MVSKESIGIDNDFTKDRNMNTFKTYCKRRKSGARFPDRKANNRLCACHCIAGNVHRRMDSEITMKPLASLLVNLKKLQHFVMSCLESPGAFELLCSAVQASTSLTALTVVIFHGNFPLKVKCSSGRLKECQAQRQQLLHLAIHHPSITRFETSDCDSSPDDDDLMNIVTEVLKTKGKPHQLTQLDLGPCTSISKEGVDRIRELIQREELNFTIAIYGGTFQYSGGIVTTLPPWLPLQK